MDKEYKLKSQAVGLLIKAEGCITRGNYGLAQDTVDLVHRLLDQLIDGKLDEWNGSRLSPPKSNVGFKPTIIREKGIKDGYED